MSILIRERQGLVIRNLHQGRLLVKERKRSMDILGFLKERKSFFNQEVHPYAYYDNKFKYTYCFGVGVITYGSIRSTAETKKYFGEFLECIMLHHNLREKLIQDITNHFDYKINDVFALLDTKEKQYIFIADLYRIGVKSVWAQTYTDSVIEIYMKVFRFTREEKEFFCSFSELAVKKNKEEAQKCYRKFEQEGFYVSYKILKYMFPSFTLHEVYNNLVLDNGEKMFFDKPISVHGDIIVKNGASLELDGAKLNIHGSIIIDDGRISIKRSQIIVEGCNTEYFMEIHNVAILLIEDSEINCNYWAGFLKQEKGYLFINNSQIEKTSFARAIHFDGHTMEMNGSNMRECRGGGISLYNYSVMNIDDCDFSSCFADHGGAVYSESLNNVAITNSRFYQCQAKYIAGAIYFTYKKYGQLVYRCKIEECEPEEDPVFNDFVSKSVNL